MITVWRKTLVGHLPRISVDLAGPPSLRLGDEAPAQPKRLGRSRAQAR